MICIRGLSACSVRLSKRCVRTIGVLEWRVSGDGVSMILRCMNASMRDEG